MNINRKQGRVYAIYSAEAFCYPCVDVDVLFHVIMGGTGLYFHIDNSGLTGKVGPLTLYHEIVINKIEKDQDD